MKGHKIKFIYRKPKFQEPSNCPVCNIYHSESCSYWKFKQFIILNLFLDKVSKNVRNLKMKQKTIMHNVEHWDVRL